MTDSRPPFFSRPLVRMGLIAAGAAVATMLVMALYSNVSMRKARPSKPA